MQERREPIDAKLVQDFVANAHGNLERVKELLEQEANLINAVWDWGGGDWETALGAAAHMGRRDIAEFLLSRGGRIDLFAAAMLGKLDVVKAVIATFPGAQQVRGPHGFSLIHHARQGGAEAAAVLAYLESLPSA